MDSNDLTATLYFAAALRAGADSSLTRLLPLQRLKEPLAPHESFSQRILFALQALGVIQPELSLSNAEDWLTAKDWFEMGPQTLAWRICWSTGDCRERHTMANALLSGIEPSDDVLAALLDVWRDLALAEVVQYADWELAKSGYNPKWAEAARGFRLPIHAPDWLEARLQDMFAQLTYVESAYLAEMIRPDDPENFVLILAAGVAPSSLPAGFCGSISARFHRAVTRP